MIRWGAGGLLAGGAALAPVSLDLPFSRWWVVAPVLVAAVLGGASAGRDAYRPHVAGLLTAWLVTALAVADGPVTGAAVGAGLLLRVWCGLPEALVLGRELVSDLLSGGAVALLLVAVSRGVGPEPADLLLLSLGGAAAFAAAGVRLLSR